jgi:hypothetical protein
LFYYLKSKNWVIVDWNNTKLHVLNLFTLVEKEVDYYSLKLSEIDTSYNIGKMIGIKDV